MNSRAPLCTAFLLLIGLLATSARCADSGVATNSDVSLAKRQETLINAIEQEFPTGVGRDRDGRMRFLDVPFRYVTDDNLALVGQCVSLKELRLRLLSRNYQLTPDGITNLARIPDLESLAVMCPHVLHAGLLDAIAKLTSVRSLTLNRADPSPTEYSALTNMTQLQELIIIEAPHFGDTEALHLVHLPNLKRLTLAETSVSDGWLAVARNSATLTNVTVRSWDKNETVVWSRMEPHAPVKAKTAGSP